MIAVDSTTDQIEQAAAELARLGATAFQVFAFITKESGK